MKNNIPDAYQKGWVEFYKLRFKVSPDVLIPRPETELLVDDVLNFLKDSHVAEAPQNDNKVITILDLGTGSGAIAISVAKNLTSGVRVNIIASDISTKALKVARQNAKLHNVEDKITFIQSDLLNNCHPELDSGSKKIPKQVLHDSQEMYDIIVTNLPYIPTERIDYLDSSVKDFEPRVALDGGEDGFELYRKLFQQLSTLGVELDWHPRLIAGEIDYTHGDLAISEAKKYFPDAKVEIKNDLAHKQRILKISF